MAEEKQKNTEDYQLELGKLLQKKRSEKQKQKIDEILQQDISLKEKVEGIKKLDNESDSGYLSRPKSHSKKTDNGKEGFETEINVKTAEESIAEEEQNKAGRREVRRNRERIKAHITEPGFFTFLFVDAGKIRKFGRETGVFRLGLLPTSFKIDKVAAAKIGNQVLKPRAKELIHIVNPILEDGWKYLSKHEYNLLVLLSYLCNELERIDFEVLNYKNRYLINTFREVEKYFLILNKEDAGGQEISWIFQKYAEKNQQDTVNLNKAVAAVQVLLAGKGKGLSLFDLIRGLNMVRFKRFVELRELTEPGAGPYMMDREFECTGKIQEKIALYLKDIIRHLTPLVNELREIERVKLFVPKDQENKAVEDIVQQFYNKVYQDSSSRFEEDNENIVILASRLGEAVSRGFGPFLSGQIMLSGVGKTRVFDSQFFHSELTKIDLLVGKLDKLSFSFPTFPEKRFIHLKNTGKGATGKEAEALQLIDELFSQVVQIGKKIKTLLRHRQEPTSNSEAASFPLEAFVLQKKNYIIPYISNRIEHQPVLEEKPLLDCLHYVVQLTFAAGILLNENSLDAMLKKEAKIREDLDAKMKTIERIAKPETYRKVREKYGI